MAYDIRWYIYIETVAVESKILLLLLQHHHLQKDMTSLIPFKRSYSAEVILHYAGTLKRHFLALLRSQGLSLHGWWLVYLHGRRSRRRDSLATRKGLLSWIKRG
jgi:hypothetical protein